jgi:hypothetical protein
MDKIVQAAVVAILTPFHSVSIKPQMSLLQYAAASSASMRSAASRATLDIHESMILREMWDVSLDILTEENSR